MHYTYVIEGRFLSRPNRFTAWVEIDGVSVLCHVKNTGRLRELLQEGCVVSLCPGMNPARKTPYDVIAVKKDGAWVNIDSQVTNTVFAEWARQQYGDALHREVTHGSSRFDFCIGEDFFIEVKGVTLRVGETALFPDAPTLRGEKHLHELAQIVRSGGRAAVAFIAAIPGCRSISPHPERESFVRALRQAHDAGVELWGFSCGVTRESISISGILPVTLP